jgi:glutamine synthetase
MENYCKVVRIEAATLVDMVQHMLLSAGITYSGALCSTIQTKKAALPGDSCRVETALAGSVSHLTEELLDRCAELKTALETMPASYTGEQEMRYCHDVIFAGMTRVRETVDHMETLVASSYWPVPTYCDLLFSV